MNRKGVVLTLFLGLRGVCFGQAAPAAAPQAIPLPEVSGAVNIGNDRLLLIADEGYQVQRVTSAHAAFETGSFKDRMQPLSAATNGSKKSKEIMDDIEDIAWDPVRSAAFAITSHSRSKKQDDVKDPRGQKPERHKLARLLLKNGTVDAQEIGTLADALKAVPFVADAMKRPHQAGGEKGTFNIEGLAFEPSQGRLLIGLRSPTVLDHGKPAAVVLSLKNPHAMFDPPQTKAILDTQPMLLDLEGAGIRGMTWDAERKGVWIVAGRSADPDQPVDKFHPSVWFWDPNHTNRPLRKALLDLGQLENLESVCMLDRNGKHGLLLISDDGGDSPVSRYLWVPASETPGSK